MALDQATITTYVQQMLGADGTEGVEVELTSGQIVACTGQSLRVLNRYQPAHYNKSLPLLTGVAQYVLTEYGKGVVDCVPQPSIRPSVNTFDAFNPYHFLRKPLDVATFHGDMMELANARRVMSADFGWEWDEETTTLWIKPVPMNSMTAVYTYAADRTLAGIRGEDEDWFLRMVLAQCKYPLGRMRAKFEGLRGLEHSFNMDGNALVAESREEVATLTQELRSRTGELGIPMRV